MDKLQLVLVKPYSEEVFFENLIIKYIDDYISVVWTDRYSKAGEIELIVPATSDNIDTYQQGYFILCDRSTKGMIIESIELTKSANGDAQMTIKGRSAEALLDRRIVMDSIEICNFTTKKNKNTIVDTLDGVLIKELIGPALIDGYCEDDQRIIENFGATMTELPEEGEPAGPFDEYEFGSYIKRGTNLYQCVCDICDSYAIGFKVDVSLPDTTMDMPSRGLIYTLSFYKSVDRSYNQNERPYVTFSTNLDNLKDVKFLETSDKYKNVGLVLGEIPNNNEKKQHVELVTVGEESTIEGLNRRETAIDAADIESKGLKKVEYTKALIQRGDEYLSSLSRQAARIFDGTIIMQSQPYVYGQDYNLGDFVQIVHSEYMKSSKVRVEEVVFSDDANGFDVSMAFTVVAYTRPSDEEGWLKYVYYYYDTRNYDGYLGDQEVIVITGFKVNEINDDNISDLPIPVQWNGYCIIVDLNHSGD